MVNNRFFIVLFGLVFFLFLYTTPVSFAAGISSNPIISQNVPAYTSDDCATSSQASLANDTSYTTYWRSCNAKPSVGTPVTLSYDFSGISTNSRKQVILAWYNDMVTGAYDHTLIAVNAYNTPKDYTIQANSSAGGGSPPSSGWVTLVTITGNHYHSRQHQIDLTGYNWVRLSATASDGTDPSNQDIAVNMDIHDATNGTTDDWIFYGDSITQQGFIHTASYGNTFSQQINAFNSSYFPVYESGGLGGFTASDAVTNINTWLPLFPGKFVALNFGTNDANSLVSASTFYNNMKTLVQAVINAGKIPIIPKIPWGCTANITSNAPILNAQIDQLYTDFPGIIKGPDLYTFFNAHQSDISGDCIHPTDPAGYTDYVTQWVTAMKTAVYTIPVMSASPVGSNYNVSQTVTLSSTKAGTIYYTTNGSTPTTVSTVYSSPLTINSTITVKAISVDQAGNTSNVMSAIYAFPTTQSNPTPTPATTSSGNPPNPNIRSGWSKEIMAGPHFVGVNSFLLGGSGSSIAQTRISTDAIHDDVAVTISKVQPVELLTAVNKIPFPWAQGLNTAGDIFHYQVVSAFNGYPIPSFDKPVTIIIPFDPKKLFGIPLSSLAIGMYDQQTGKWKILPNIVLNSQPHTLATTVKQYSYFTVVYSAKNFSVSLPTNVLGANALLANSSATLEQEIIKPITLPTRPPVKTITKPLTLLSCFLFTCW